METIKQPISSPHSRYHYVNELEETSEIKNSHKKHDKVDLKLDKDKKTEQVQTQTK
jgi:hypothetical protein